ncbi:DUF1127 domain-containing protein [Microvirga massiliensis]|uniref:DUF1127 domain-containing protein n=1 Tax=Microvirga massiliensis TaxID=1033741 RepID=UPI00062BADA3|nr:DUF1127 domain-containing protein [Microvirga massiliensis]
MSTLSHAVEFRNLTDHEAHTGSIAVKRLASRVYALIASASRRAALRRARCGLLEMPDHLLKDLGITRSEIAWIVEHGRFGRIDSEG